MCSNASSASMVAIGAKVAMVKKKVDVEENQFSVPGLLGLGKKY